MKHSTSLLVVVFLVGIAHAEELSVSSKEPVIVVTPAKWKATQAQAPSAAFPFETYRLTPPDDRNAVCIVSILDKDKKDFTDPDFLKKLLRADSRPYVGSPEELSKLELKEMKINDGLAYYANFVDPSLIGKPAKKGKYKTGTPVILSLGSKYLIKVTVLCDEIDGADYQDIIKIVESIRIKKE